MSDEQSPAAVPGSTEPVPPPTSTVADGVEHALDPRSITLDRIGSAIRNGILSILALIAIVFSLFTGGPSRWVAFSLLGAWALVSLLLLAKSWFWPALRYKRSRYRIDESGIQFRSGVIWRSTVNVPRSRVQHTDVNQGPIERGIGLATLILHTAGTQHAAIPIPGLAEEVARRIRDHLLDEENGLDG